MNEFKTQIARPEEPPVVDATLQVDAETTEEQQIAQCQEIVQAKLEAILYSALEAIGSRIKNLELVDQKTYLHEIIAFKAALGRFYQELQFLTYDAEYGLNDKEDRVAIPIEFKGESMDRLNILEAVTLIMKFADSSLAKANSVIKGFEEVIQKAKERLADAELDDSEKDQAKHAATIASRGEKKEKQEARRDALVQEINAVLRVDPEDTDALMESAEKLLLFLIRNKWMKNTISMDQAKAPAEMMKSFSIAKNIEEPEKEEPTTPPKSHKRTNKRLLATGFAVGGLTLAALMSILFLTKNHERGGLVPRPAVYEYTKTYKSGHVKLIGFYKNAQLSDEEKYIIAAENAYRVVAGIMRGGGIHLSKTEVLQGKISALESIKAEPGLADGKTYILDYDETVLSKKCVSSVKTSSTKDYINTYALQIRRTMTVSTVIDDKTIEPFSRPLTVETTIVRKVREPKRGKIDNMQYYKFDNTKRDLEYKLTTDKNGKTGLTVRRKNGKTLLRVREKK